MSIPVAVEALREATARHGLVAHLVTVGETRPHLASVELRWDGDVLVCGAGRSTAANAAARPAVSLLWPAGVEPGYSLIVDATAAVVDGEVRLTPTSAVLHRLAGEPGEAPNCKPVGG